MIKMSSYNCTLVSQATFPLVYAYPDSFETVAGKYKENFPFVMLAKENLEGKTPLHIAIEKGNVE